MNTKPLKQATVTITARDDQHGNPCWAWSVIVDASNFSMDLSATEADAQRDVAAALDMHNARQAPVNEAEKAWLFRVKRAARDGDRDAMESLIQDPVLDGARAPYLWMLAAN